MDIGQRLQALEAKEAIRACLGRYLDLCDVPGPFTSPGELAALFTPGATWLGIGKAYAAEFGTVTGRDKVATHIAAYLPPAQHFRRNAHLLGSEQLQLVQAGGHGQWLMQQLSEYHDGSAELRCARLTIDFVVRHEGATASALISRFQTERLFAGHLTITNQTEETP